jgi:hypothetical protein
VEFEVDGDLRNSGFQWYIDEGELEKTLLTAAQRYEEPAEDAARDDPGRTWTENLWTLPEGASGTYRIWVVWVQPWDDDIPSSVPDIVWTQSEVVLP